MKKRTFLRRLSLGFRQFFAAVSGGVSDWENPALWLEGAFGGTRSTAGETVNSATVLGLPAFYACMRDISEDVGKLPLKTYRRLSPRGKEILPDHPCYKLLHDSPNPKMSAITFRETLQSWAIGWGNGFAEIEFGNGGYAQNLWPIHPSRVQVMDSSNSVSYRVKMEGGGWKDFNSQQILHIHGLGDTGIQGYAVTNVFCEMLGLSMALQKFAGSYFSNAGVVAVTLETPEELSPEAQKNLEAQWKKERGTAGQALGVKVLEGGLTLKQHTVPAEHAQFLQSRQFQVEDIARVFRMPPHKIQHLLRATFSNIEQQAIEYVVDTLTPWLVRWEQEIKKKIFADEEDVFAEHLTLGLLRGDAAARGAFHREMVFIGAMSPDDVREVENLNPLPDGIGDVYMVQSSMIPLDDLGEKPESPAIPPPSPFMQPKAPAPEDSTQEDTTPEDSTSEDATPEDTTIESALYPVFMDAALRVVRKETNESQRAIKKNAGNNPMFRRWSETFFDGAHWSTIVDAFKPAASSYADLKNGSPWTPGLAARRHIESVCLELEQAFASGKVEDFVAQEYSRADRLARAIMQEIGR